MIWLLTTLAALAAAFYIAAPFYREASLRAAAGSPLRARQRELETRREGLLRELKELELDRRMGKVDSHEYAQSRARATQEAAQVLRQLEEVRSPRPSGERNAPRVEIAKATEVPAAKSSRLDLEIEIEVAVARARRSLKSLQKAAGWKCECGREMQESDLFCASCGSRKPVEAAV